MKPIKIQYNPNRTATITFHSGKRLTVSYYSALCFHSLLASRQRTKYMIIPEQPFINQ